MASVCTVDGCERPSVARGVCASHYNHMKRAGTLPPLNPRPVRFCIVDGCENRGKLIRGLCPKHYHRWVRHGDPLKVVCPQRDRRGICTVDGCDKVDCGPHGLCHKHDTRQRRHGDPLKVIKAVRNRRELCVMDGCDELDDGPHGLCRKHRRAMKLYGHPLAPIKTQRKRRGICVIDGCDELDKGSHGLCDMHYTRLKRHGDPLKVVLPQRKQRGICTVDGCDNLDCGLNGLCQKHSARLKRHGDPLVTMRERFPHQWYRDNPDEAVWWHRERRNQEARESTARLSESGKQYRKEMHRRRKARQNAMVVNPRAGAWTPAEDAIVVREDISVTEIAFLLQRSYGAACGRRTVLRRYASGTVAPHPFHPLWTPAEDAVVMREDITVTEMCCLTGRSRRGVRARRRRLGQQYKDD